MTFPKNGTRQSDDQERFREILSQSECVETGAASVPSGDTPWTGRRNAGRGA